MRTIEAKRSGYSCDGFFRERVLAAHGAVRQQVAWQMPALGDRLVEAGPLVDQDGAEAERVHGGNGVIGNDRGVGALPVGAEPVEVHLGVDDVHRRPSYRMAYTDASRGVSVASSGARPAQRLARAATEQPLLFVI